MAMIFSLSEGRDSHSSSPPSAIISWGARFQCLFGDTSFKARACCRCARLAKTKMKISSVYDVH
jgi:hypothetical protein